MIFNNSFSRKEDSSPSFKWINASSLATNETLNVSWESYNSSSQKYLPFNLTRIINSSSSAIEFYPNQDTSNVFIISANTIQTIDRSSIPAITNFRIKALGAISAGKLIITNSRESITADSLVQRTYKRIFGEKNKNVI